MLCKGVVYVLCALPVRVRCESCRNRFRQDRSPESEPGGSMKKVLFVGLALATVLASTPAARADEFQMSLTGSGITGTGTISGPSLGGGAFNITSASMTINGLSAAIIVDPYMQAVAYDDFTTGGTITQNMPAYTDNYFSYDDILTPANAWTATDSSSAFQMGECLGSTNLMAFFPGMSSSMVCGWSAPASPVSRKVARFRQTLSRPRSRPRCCCSGRDCS